MCASGGFARGCGVDAESVDVVLSTYVLDILSDQDIAAMLDESWQVFSTLHPSPYTLKVFPPGGVT